MTQVAARPAAESRRLRAYLHTVVAVGAIVLAQSAFAAARMPRPVAWLMLTAVTLLAGCFRLHFKSVSANIAIDDTFFISTTLLFGPAAGTLTIAASCLLFSIARRKRASQVAFNTASLALSMYVAGQVFFAFAGVAPLAVGSAPIAPLVAPLVVLTVVYFVLNSALTATAVALDT